MTVMGFIGFGEASYLISKGLLQEGIDQIYAYDMNADDPSMGQVIQERVRELNVGLTETLKDLTGQCNIIVCATSAKVAESVAEEAKMFLTSDHLYVDINAASSVVKESVSNHIVEVDGQFVDGAVMGSIPVKKHQTPIFLSGNGAKAFQEIGARYGMDLAYISEKPGTSSAIKMLRSIFMKGFTTLLWETLESSHRYGVTEQVVNTLDESISGKSIEDLADTLLPRTAIHAERRVTEMEEVVKTLDTLNVDATLSSAVRNKLFKIDGLNLKKTFNHIAPDHYVDVLNALKSKKRE